MHLSAVQSTMPVTGFFVRAWNGQAETQAGSPQCMHCCFTKLSGWLLVALQSLMIFLVDEFSSSGARCRPSRLTSGSRLFAVTQAETHALQPMHLVASKSSPRAPGGI